MTIPSDPHAPHRALLPERPFHYGRPEPRRPVPTSTGIDEVIGWLELVKKELSDHPQQARDFAIIALDLLGKEVGMYGLMDRLDAETARESLKNG